MIKVTHADCGGWWEKTGPETYTCDRCGKEQVVTAVLEVPVISACQFEES